MAVNSAIQWTEATWNPVVGCSILTPGCIHCYAMGEAARQIRCARGQGRETHYAGTVKTVKGKPVWTGKLALAPEHILLQPLKRKKPTTYFVNSMGDLFHEDCPDDWIDKVFAVMALSPQHTFQVLTKRAGRMRKYFDRYDAPNDHNSADKVADAAAVLLGKPGTRGSDRYNGKSPGWPLPNVWLGVSTERQQEADERIPLLLETPAAIRFISAEPLLGPMDLHPLGCGTNAITSSTGPNLDWVITGGESGQDARPSHPQWYRDIRDQCAAGGVAYFHKQNGEWAPGECADKPPTRTEQGATWWNDTWLFETITPRVSEETHTDDAPDVYRLGKKAAGRMLDGVEHNGFPKVPA